MLDKLKKLPVFAKIISILIIIGIGYFFYSKSKANSLAKPTYQTSVAEKGTLISSLTATGQVASTNSRTVTTTASGVVKKIFVKEGQKVLAGTPILQIDFDLDGRQKYQQALASYISAQNNLKTAQDKFYSLQSDLVNTKNIFVNQWSMQSPDDPTYIQKHNAYLTAQANFDNLQNSLKQAEASFESSRLSYQLAGSIVYAPIPGTVSAISLFPGMILNPTSSSSNSSNIENKIAIVKTGATPAITVSLTEIDVPKVKVGNKVTVTLDAIPGKTFTGKIIAIDTTGTVSSSVVNYPTTIQLDTEVPEILANMSATVNIIIDFRDDVLIVPSTSVINVNGETNVRTLVNGQVKNVPVQIGLISNTESEIISGLNVGDTVVTAIIQTKSAASSTTTSPFGSMGGNRSGGAVRIQGR